MSPLETNLLTIANVRLFNPHKSVSAQIGLMAMATGMTLVNMCTFLLENEGPNEEVEAFRARMREFYGT